MSATIVYGGSGGSTLIIEDESVTVTGGPQSTLDFVGAGVTVTDAGSGQANITIPGGGASALNDLTDVTLTSPATGGILYKSSGDWLDTAAINVAPNGDVTLFHDRLAGEGYSFAVESTGVNLWDMVGSSPNNLRIRFLEGDPFEVTLANLGFTGSDNFIIENLTGAGNLILDTFSGLVIIQHQGTDQLTSKSGGIRFNNEIEIDGALNHDGTTVGFYGTTPTTQQTGVAVTDAAIHAALVTLGLITA